MKILVITSVFPNSIQPTLGVFVRERMFKVAKYHEIKIVAPVPWFPFINLIKKNYRPAVPFWEIQDGIEVYHPKFFNIPAIFKSLDGLFFFFSSVLLLRKIRKTFNFDLIDAHFSYPDGFGAVLLGKYFKRPVTITVRGTIRKLMKYRLRKIQIRYALEKANRVFAVCNDLRNAAIETGRPESTTVTIPNGVDIEKFTPIDKVKAREELGLPIDAKIIISVGGLVERKGFHRVLSILPRILKKDPSIKYLIVGGPCAEGNYEPVLRQMAIDLGISDHVIFAGAQPHDHLYKWLSASDVFCLATSNEGWANVFLEAMACGLPVITTRVGGNEEVIASPEYGLLFNLGDQENMADALMTALRTDWNRNKIIDYAKANTWEQRINQLITELETLDVNSKGRVA